MIDSKITHETGEQWNKQEGQKLIDLFFWDGIFIDPAYLLGKHSYPRTLFLSRVEKRLDRSWLIKCGSNFTISVLLNFRAEIFCLRSNPVKTRFSHVSCGLKIHHQILKGWCAVLNFTPPCTTQFFHPGSWRWFAEPSWFSWSFWKRLDAKWCEREAPPVPFRWMGPRIVE